MNERFESLAEEAMVHVPGSTGLHSRAFSLEKFAELIVKECMLIVGDGTVDGEIYHDRIKYHFGVEE